MKFLVVESRHLSKSCAQPQQIWATYPVGELDHFLVKEIMKLYQGNNWVTGDSRNDIISSGTQEASRTLKLISSAILKTSTLKNRSGFLRFSLQSQILVLNMDSSQISVFKQRQCRF